MKNKTSNPFMDLRDKNRNPFRQDLTDGNPFMDLKDSENPFMELKDSENPFMTLDDEKPLID